MSTSEVAFLSSYLVDLAISLLFLVGFIYRIYILSKMASQKNQTYRTSFWIKIVLLGCYIIVDIIELALALSDPNFWLEKQDQLSLILLVPICSVLCQMYIIVLQHKKKERPMMWHKIYWAYELLVTLVQLVFVFVFGFATIHILIPLVKIVIMLCLLVYSVFFQEEHFEMDLLLAPTPPITARSTNPTQGTELTTMEKPLFIEFNSIPNIHFKGAVRYEFSIAVYGDGTGSPHIINRFEEDFWKLQKDMERALNHSEDVSFPEVVRTCSLSHIGEGQLKVKTYEQFLIRLTRSTDYYVEPLLDFLEITGQRKLRLLEMNKRRIYEGSFSLNDLEPSISTSDRKFFTVQFRDKATIRLLGRECPVIEQNKTSRQIEELHSKMFRQSKVKKDMLDERENHNYEEFLEYCANSPKNWFEFSSWLGLSRKVQLHVNRILDMWYNGLDFASLGVLGYQLVANKHGETYTVYNFQFKRHRDSKKSIRLRKRFSDFTRLNEQIIIYYRDKKYHGLKMPSLPPKIAAFGNRTSPKSREKQLEAYLKRLLVLQTISTDYVTLDRCVPFLEFLQPDESQDTKTIYAPKDGEVEEDHTNNGMDVESPSVDLDVLGVSNLR